LLWIAGFCSGSDKQKLIFAMCACAELSANFEPSDKQLEIAFCLEVLKDYAIGGRSDTDDICNVSEVYYNVASSAAYASIGGDNVVYVADCASSVVESAVYNVMPNCKGKNFIAEQITLMNDCANAIRSYYPKAPKLFAILNFIWLVSRNFSQIS